MVYHSPVLTPANTDRATPLGTPFKLTAGLAYRFEVYFPPGSCGLAGIRVYLDGTQILPRDRGVYFTGNDLFRSYEDFLSIENTSNELLIETYNEDESFCHTIYLSVGIVSRQEFIDAKLPMKSLSELASSLSAVMPLLQMQPGTIDTDLIGALSGNGS